MVLLSAFCAFPGPYENYEIGNFCNVVTPLFESMMTYRQLDTSLHYE